jgi:hypothetical protein
MKLEQRNIEYDERINRYLRGLMGDDERKAFEQEVDGNEELRERLVSTSLLVQGIIEEGMNREGQYQLDTISQMSPEEFEEATMGESLPYAESADMTIDTPIDLDAPDAPKRSKSQFWWISGLAASIALVVGLFLINPTTNQQPSDVAYEVACDTAIEIESPITIKQPTLASLAKEYNKPIAGEPDKFVAIRQQIQNEEAKDMMAVVYDIDKIQAPTYNEGAMGAENAEVIKEMQQMHNDCTHWYKALAFLKKGDKDSAIRELNNLKEHGSNEDLVKRATALLKKLKK